MEISSGTSSYDKGWGQRGAASRKTAWGSMAENHSGALERASRGLNTSLGQKRYFVSGNIPSLANKLRV